MSLAAAGKTGWPRRGERTAVRTRPPWLEVHTEHAALDPRAEFNHTIIAPQRPTRRAYPPAECVFAPAGPEQGFAEQRFEAKVEFGRRHERGCSLEQVRRSSEFLTDAARSPPPRRRRAASARAASRGSPARSGSDRPARGDSPPAHRDCRVRRGAPRARRRGEREGPRACFRHAFVGGISIKRWRKRKASSPVRCGLSGLISSLRTRAARRGVTWLPAGVSA